MDGDDMEIRPLSGAEVRVPEVVDVPTYHVYVWEPVDSVDPAGAQAYHSHEYRAHGGDAAEVTSWAAGEAAAFRGGNFCVYVAAEENDDVARLYRISGTDPTRHAGLADA